MSDEPLPQSEIILYQTEDGRTRIQCRLENGTIWLSQALIADLFQVTVPTVNEHLKGIYNDSELEAGATIRKFRIVRSEGRREVERKKEPGTHFFKVAIWRLVPGEMLSKCPPIKDFVVSIRNNTQLHL